MSSGYAKWSDVKAKGRVSDPRIGHRRIRRMPIGEDPWHCSQPVADRQDLRMARSLRPATLHRRKSAALLAVTFGGTFPRRALRPCYVLTEWLTRFGYLRIGRLGSSPSELTGPYPLRVGL